MSSKLTPQLLRFLEFLSSKRAGDVVGEDEILTATAWKPSTLSTHHRKHVLDPFLTQEDKGSFRVLRDGHLLTNEEISRAFTQNRPGQLALTKGMVVTGERGSYELMSLMGMGAAAHVWRCKNVASGKLFAAKVVNPRLDLLDPANLEVLHERFSREARNGIRLAHPNIVTYRDYGEVDAHPFLIMDLATMSLADLLKKGPLPLSKTVDIVHSCLRGLEHLHDAGCVHRDIKPPNVLIFGSRFAVGDLGIVRWSDMNPAFTSAGTLTRASVHLGSWYYMAPEQRTSPHDALPASDIYALGVSWYEMLTGITPDPAGVAARQFKPAAANTAASALIEKMLSFAPSDRPTTKQLIEHANNLRTTL
jgi:serine/threonine protein kinase